MGFSITGLDSNLNIDSQKCDLKDFNCVYANVQSIFNKKTEIEIYNKDNWLDIMFYTESFISDEHHASEYNFNGYQCFTAKRPRGGVAIYVKNNISCHELNPPNKAEDSTWLIMNTFNNIKRVYGCIYRSPNSSPDNNSKILENMRWINELCNEIVLVGDFNLPTINWETLTSHDAYSDTFIETLDSMALEQLIRNPTRYRQAQTPSILDLLIVPNPELVSQISILDAFGKSDHCRLEFIIKNCHAEKIRKTHRYNYKKMADDIFISEMNAVDWNAVIEHDIESGYNSFIKTVQSAIEKSTPKMSRNNNNAAPWSNRRIEQLAKIKRNLWDRYRRTQDRADYANYKRALNDFNHEKDLAIENYETTVLANKNTNKKKYFNYISKKNKYSDNKMTLKNGDNMVSDDKKCAEIMNSYFSSVFTHQDENPSNADLLLPREFPDMPDLDITANMIELEINILDTSKSTGPDMIPALLIKKFKFQFTEILLLIFRKSYHEGKVPSQMKTARIRPIFKSGVKTEPSNYRPVSLTSIIAKMFERIIKQHIESHIDTHDILSECQHGFRRHKSTSTNLISFMNDLATYANDSKSVSVIYTDFRKAFDRVPHNLLLFKLEKLGISGKTNSWLRDFLFGRTQQVHIGSELSSTSEVMSGVPQGGALSGTLFSLFINDLPIHIKNASISMYADDAKIYMPIQTEQDISKLQEDIDRAVQWCNVWKMSMNPSKCFLLQYNPRSTLRQFNPTYNIEGEAILRSSVVKDLGVMISENLKFHDHVDRACERANSEINRIRRSFSCRSPSFIKDMFKLYVRPHLEYAVEVWNPRDRGDVLKIEKVQNKMTRLIPMGSRLSSDARNSVLGLTSHEKRRLRGDLINTFKHIDNQSLFTMRNDERFRGHNKTVRIPRSNCLVKKHSFSCRSLNEWNGLPQFIVDSRNINAFKNNIDRHIFSI